MPYVVQFPHPGSEHKPTPAIGAVMGWNTGEHKRKFLRAEGHYVLDGERRTGAYGFWGEWEPPSRVLQVWPKGDTLPRFLHEPLYRTPDSPAPEGEHFQNSDPLVFGDRFLYSNCRQQQNSKLRGLTAGSIVLFGSMKGGFVLDTVFVVGGEAPRPFELGEAGVLYDNALTDAVVFEPLATPPAPGQHCVAYTARMRADGSDQPHSFVPCLPADADEPRFARPLLDPVGPLADLIVPKLAMNAGVREVSEQQAADVWAHVAEVCARAGLAQGVWAAPPDLPADRSPLPHETGSSAGSCRGSSG